MDDKAVNGYSFELKHERMIYKVKEQQ